VNRPRRRAGPGPGAVRTLHRRSRRARARRRRPVPGAVLRRDGRPGHALRRSRKRDPRAGGRHLCDRPPTAWAPRHAPESLPVSSASYQGRTAGRGGTRRAKSRQAGPRPASRALAAAPPWTPPPLRIDTRHPHPWRRARATAVDRASAIRPPRRSAASWRCAVRREACDSRRHPLSGQVPARRSELHFSGLPEHIRLANIGKVLETATIHPGKRGLGVISACGYSRGDMPDRPAGGVYQPSPAPARRLIILAGRPEYKSMIVSILETIDPTAGPPPARPRCHPRCHADAGGQGARDTPGPVARARALKCPLVRGSTARAPSSTPRRVPDREVPAPPPMTRYPARRPACGARLRPAVAVPAAIPHRHAAKSLLNNRRDLDKHPLGVQRKGGRPVRVRQPS